MKNGSYLWLKGHPVGKKPRRPKIPAGMRHRDRKNDYRRRPKHPGRESQDL